MNNRPIAAFIGHSDYVWAATTSLAARNPDSNAPCIQ
jgi:hypothetical protein